MYRRILVFVAYCCLLNFSISAQEHHFSRSSIKTGIALAVHEGSQEEGTGILMSVGYQRSYRSDRFRINPNIMAGNFRPVFITDTPDEFYRLTSLGLNGYMDALRVRTLSLFVGTGSSLNYSRGLIGTGGYNARKNSDYFHKLYLAGSAEAGLRYTPKAKKLAVELAFLNIHAGTEYHLLAMFDWVWMLL